MTPTQEQVDQILRHIVESPDFKDSQRYCELLQYLVAETLAGRVPKEIEIGMRFFGKEPGFHAKEDATVRVYINNLRKKLEHYYLTCAKPGSIRLVIPKGHYKVEFLPAEPAQVSAEPRSRRALLYPALAVVLVAVFALGIAADRLFLHPQAAVAPPNAAWNEFLRNDGRPILIVLGDYFFLHERGKVGNYYRNMRINSPDEYLQYIARNPDFAKQYEKNDFTFLRPSAPWCLMQILPIVRNAPNGFTLKLASQFTVDDFKSNNVIFIGSFKTLFTFQKFLHVFRLEYTLSPSSVRIHDGRGDSLHVFTPENLTGGNYEKDYGILAKGQGPDGSSIMMLLGFSESGVIEASRAASDPALFAAIAEKCPAAGSVDPASFTLVIGTEGITQAIFNANIKYVTAAGAAVPPPAHPTDSAGRR